MQDWEKYHTEVPGVKCMVSPSKALAARQLPQSPWQPLCPIQVAQTMFSQAALCKDFTCSDLRVLYSRPSPPVMEKARWTHVTSFDSNFSHTTAALNQPPLQCGEPVTYTRGPQPYHPQCRGLFLP